MAEHVVTQIQDRMKTVYNLVVNDLNTEHNKSSSTISAINKIHDKAKAPKQDEKKMSNANKQKLKDMYSTALADAMKEEQIICQALEKIYEIYAIKNEVRIKAKSLGNKETFRRGALMKALTVSAQTLPLWTGKLGEIPPALCGAIPADLNYVAKVGDMVAALQRSPEGDDNWILAEVVSYNATSSKYEVDDIDEEQKERITLSRRRVVPLPLMRANPGTHSEAFFQRTALVQQN